MKNPSRKKSPGKGSPLGGGSAFVSTLISVADLIPFPILAVDPSGAVILWNRAMAELTGVPAEDMLGRTDHAYAIPFYGTARPMLVDLVLHPEKDIGRIYDFIRGDKHGLTAEGPVTLSGRQRYLWCMASRLTDPQGNKIGAIQTVQDITERKSYEEALRTSEAKYKDIFLNVSDLLYIHDLNGRFVETNLAAKKETGYTEEDLLRIGVQDLLPARHRHRFVNYLHNVLEKGYDEGFLTIVTKDGSERIVEYRNSLVRDERGAPVAIRGTARDITSRIRMQKQLRRERDLVTSIIETSPAFFDAVDGSGRVVMMNGAMLGALGYKADEVLGKDYAETFLAPEDRGDFAATLEELLRTDKPVDHEKSILAKDGRRLTVQWHRKAMFRPDGSVEFVFGIGIDVTNQRKAQQKLMERERQLRTLVGNLPGMAYRCKNDASWTMLFVSDASVKLTGYTPDELIGNRGVSFADIIHPDDAPGVWEEVQKAVSEHRPYQLTYRITTKDGTERFVWEQGQAVYDDAGSCMFLEGFIMDVTQRVEAEKALRESEARYRLLAENIRDVIWVFDTNLRYVYISPSVQRMRGYTVEEAMKQTVDQIIAPWHLQHVMDVFNEEVQRERAGPPREPYWSRSIEAEVMRKDGSTLWAEISASFLKDDKGEIQGFVGITRDITERKKAEIALRESEERFRTMAEAMPEAFWMTTPSWDRLLYVNPAFEQVFGLSGQEAAGDPRVWVGLVYEEDRPFVERMFEPASTSEVKEEFRIVRPDGTLRWVRVRMTPIKDKDGDLRYILGMAEDITDRKRMEEDREIAEARLVRAQKLEAIGTLAGGIAHDFNNILVAIIGYSELALDDIPEGTRAHESVSEILRAGERARDLIRQILTFSRQVESERRAVSVPAIVKEAMKLLRSSIPTTITIVDRIDSSVPNVLADPTQIHQVILNLCTNAYHAMSPAGGTMTICVDAVDVDEGMASHHPGLRAGPHVRLSVQDTGCGMDEEVMKRIFDPFFTTKEKGKGTGLGLSTVHGIVSSLGGAVVVKSEVGRGSTFDVYLPIIEASGEDQEATGEDLPRGSGQRVLVVDDEAWVLDITRSMLEQLGYRPVTASSSTEALTIFRERPADFDIVITDQTMPGMTGADLARAVLCLRSDVPVILMTGFSEIIGPEEAMSLGIRGYMEKPFTMGDLAHKLASCLDS